MSSAITKEPSDTDSLERRAAGGNRDAFDQLFEQHHERLQKMVRLRMDRRLRLYVDSAGVLAESREAAFRRIGEYASDPAESIFLWLRQVTAETMKALHERHVGPQEEGAVQEVTLFRGSLPEASSVSLAAQLMGKMTNIVDAAVKAESKLKVQEALNNLEPLDREVLALRHFERLSNDETALALGIKRSEASNRYISALTRLHGLLASVPGFTGRL